MSQADGLTEVGIRRLNKTLAGAQAREGLVTGGFPGVIAVRLNDVFRQDENRRVADLPESLN